MTKGTHARQTRGTPHVTCAAWRTRRPSASPGRRSRTLPRPRDRVLLDSPDQRRPRDPEPLGGERLVPGARVEGLDDSLPVVGRALALVGGTRRNRRAVPLLA